MKHLYKIFGIFLSLALCISLMGPQIKVHAEESGVQTSDTVEENGAQTSDTVEEDDAQTANTVEIRTVEDLIELADKCKSDAYSKNLTVELENDLDLSQDLLFQGISSFSGTFHGNGHTITGYMNLDAEGIIGFIRFLEKGGKVDSLNVEATISTEDSNGIIGGIVAVNEGTVSNSSFSGSLAAKSVVGGIAGENGTNGRIHQCSSSGDVSSPSMCGGIAGKNYGTITDCTNKMEVDTDSSWLEDDEQTTSLLQNTLTTLLTGNNIGGIAGYSNGLITGSVNRASVGYIHEGYNVGGIVGRNAGRILSSANYGNVLGKQDVGGIAGQFEPYTEYTDAEKLQEAIEKLHDLINTMVDDLDQLGSGADQELSNLKTRSDALTNTAYSLVDEVKNVVNYDVNQINVLSSRIQTIFSMLPQVVDPSENAIQKLQAFSNDFQQLAADVDLQAFVENYDPSAYSQELISAMTRVNELKQDIQNILTDDSGNTRSLTELSEEELSQLVQDLANLLSALSDERNAAEQVILNINTITESLASYVDTSLEPVATDISRLQTDAEALVTDLESSLSGVKAITDYAEGLSGIQFKGTSQSFDTNSSQLKAELDAISNGLDALRENFSENSDTVEEDFRSISDQISRIFEILYERLDNLENGLTELNMISDQSASDPTKATKIYNCSNYGRIEGNTNIGGIAGAIDVEGGTSDDTATLSVGNLLNAYAIIKNSTNAGFVTAKSNYAGGITGQAALGYLVNCTGKGAVKSTDGDYVGGIAGKMVGTIDSCYSLAELSGDSYIGGIAGAADHVTNCCSMAFMVQGDSRYGAIIGEDETDQEELSSHHSSVKERISENYFVSSSLGGIDGVSYEGVAEGITYEELLKIQGLPEDFSNLEVWFVDENGDIIEKGEIWYGEPVSEIQYPEVTSQQGSYHDWSGIYTETVENNLILYLETEKTVTVLVSETNEDGKALLMASGQYQNGSVLLISASEEKAPEITDRQQVSVWDIALKNTNIQEDQTVTLRIYNPSKGTASLYLLEDGKWVPTFSTAKGQYLEFQIQGDHAVVAMVTEEVQETNLLPWLIGGGVLLLAVIVLAIVLVKRKKGKAGKV